MDWSKSILVGNGMLDWRPLLLLLCCMLAGWVFSKVCQNRRQKAQDRALCQKKYASHRPYDRRGV